VENNLKELLEALEQQYEGYNAMWDNNVERMLILQKQIGALKEHNTSLITKMKEVAEKMRQLKGEK
jgi:hypothetical protein